MVFFPSILWYKKLDKFLAKFVEFTLKKNPKNSKKKGKKKDKICPQKKITSMQEEVSKSFVQMPNPWEKKEIKYPYKLIVNPPTHLCGLSN